MSSPYFRPASTVQQEFQLVPTGSVAPQPACIVGPMFQVLDVNDSGDRALLGLGSYDPDADEEFSYPSRAAGGRVDLDSVKLRMENVWARYATFASDGTIKRGSKANRINIPSGNAFQNYTNAAGTAFLRNTLFKKRDVTIGDRVKITANSISLETRITGFVHADIASATGTPSATSNRANQSYAGAAVDTEVEDTDHLSSIDVATTQFIGDNSIPSLSDVYVLECIGAGVAGIQQVETATVAGAIGGSGAGNATVIVTSAHLTGSPLTVSVAVANSDTDAQVAGKIRTALGLVEAITDIFTVGGSSTAVSLTKILPAANDATLNISVNNGTCTGLTPALTSANTTAGAVGTATFKVTSDGGDNVAELSFENIAFGTPFDVGTRGLRVAIASAGSEAFIVGEKFTFTVTAAYTRSAPTLISDSDDYTGAFDTTYKIEVIKGGRWSQLPQVVVTTNNAIDSAAAQVIDFDTNFEVGNLGLVVKFANELTSAQNGLVLGDVYYITATAAQKGAVRTATLANPIDLSILEGDNLAVEFSIFKSTIDIPSRGYPSFSSVAVTPEADIFTVSGGITINDSTWLENDGVTLGALEVVKATMFVSYRALLSAMAGVIRSISELSAVEAVLGKVTTPNPLGISVYKALQNSAGQAVFFLPIASDDLAGYTAALAPLERDERPYFRVPTTTDEAIKDLFASHVTSQSSPNKGRECMGIVATASASTSLMYNKKGDGSNWTGYVEAKPGVSPEIFTNISVPGATFLTDGVRAGDQVRCNFGVDAFGEDTYETVTVDEVIDEENIVAVSPGFSEAIGDVDNLQRIQVVRLLTLDEQAAVLRDTSEALFNRRISNVFQDIGSDLPAYVFAAAVAGLASSVAPHQPITNYTLVGFNDEDGSQVGFTPEQLDLIASGGTLVISKSTVEGQVFIRHQLTTDRTDDRRAEMSVTRNFDSVSRFLRDGFSPFQGKFNIQEGYFQLLDVTMRRRLDLLASLKVTESAGRQLNSWDQRSLAIAQDPVAKTKVRMAVTVDFPLPGNRTELVITAAA